MKKQAFIITSHNRQARWETLARLMDDDMHSRHLYLFDEDFYVCRMSNDKGEDQLQQFLKEKVAHLADGYLLLNLCPDFDKGAKTTIILEQLDLYYDLHFFVLTNADGNYREVSKYELTHLSLYGGIHIEENPDAYHRAKRLKRFIQCRLNKRLLCL